MHTNPFCTGMGVVTKVGSAVSGFKEGQRVTSLGWMAHEGGGSWQQYANVPVERVVALPDGVTDEAGAQFYVCTPHPCKTMPVAGMCRAPHGVRMCVLYKPGMAVMSVHQLIRRCSTCFTYLSIAAAHLLCNRHVPNQAKPTPLSSTSLQINPVTVIGLLEVSGAKEGDHIVITAAGSTLSRMLIRAAKAQGIKTIGVVRRPEAVQEVKDSTG